MISRRLAVSLLGLLLLSVAANAQASRRVAILYADSTKHTLRTISGLEWSLRGCDPPCTLVTRYLRILDETQVASIAAEKPELLVTIGTNATAFANRNFPQLPIVFAKVLNPIESGFIASWDKPGGRITGAALDIPVSQQIKRFSEVIPQLKRIGVIYTKSTARLVEEARRATSALGLQLVEIVVTSTKELPPAIDSLCHSVDGIWTVADEELSTPQFIRHTLMETLRCGVPIMGFNQNFVETGALFCLEADYKFIGRQAGELALQVLSGREIASVKPTTPDVVYLYLNLKSSKLLNIDLSQELISVAKETY